MQRNESAAGSKTARPRARSARGASP